MKKKGLVFAVAVLVVGVAVAGVMWSGWEKRTINRIDEKNTDNEGVELAMNGEETVTDSEVNTQNDNEIDISGWKIYRNEERCFEFNYPPTWIEEDGTLYSPRMYNMKNGGPYSLYIEVYPYYSNNHKIYLNNTEDKCIENLQEISFKGKNINKYRDLCMYSKPDVFTFIVNDKVFVGTSYSLSIGLDNLDTILKILVTINIFQQCL